MAKMKRPCQTAAVSDLKSPFLGIMPLMVISSTKKYDV